MMAETQIQQAFNLILPANEDEYNRGLEGRVLKVGERLRDGTVVLSFNEASNEAIFVSEQILFGLCIYDRQNEILESFNFHGLHGHKDWRLIADDEAKTLANIWYKVAPKVLLVNQPPCFWIPKLTPAIYGRVRQGGNQNFKYVDSNSSYAVSLVRSGPARVIEI